MKGYKTSGMDTWATIPISTEALLKMPEKNVTILQCKIEGLIPYTEQELLTKKLNAAFPNAKSKQIVELDGVKYKNTYTLREISNSGKTVKSWHQERIKQ